jgi:hypothetical protein
MTILSVLAGAGYWYWNYQSNLRRPRVIRNPDDPDVDRIEQLQLRRFGPDETDELGIVRRFLAQNLRTEASSNKPKSQFIAITLKERRQLKGYLTAEYFPKEHLIFFWYIVHATSAQDDDAAVEMLGKLFQECDRISPWEHLMAEVESGDREKALSKMRRFRYYATKLAKTDEPRVFKINVDYRMPVHDAALLGEAEKHELPAWLVYAPKSANEITHDGSRRFMSGHVVRRLLVTLILRGYRDETDEQYQAYLISKTRSEASKVPDPVELVHNARSM